VTAPGGRHRWVLAAFAALLVAASAPPLPSMSLWQLRGSWQRAGGAELKLAELRGQPALVLLFYGTCDSVCPALVKSLQQVEQELPTEARARVRFVLVTIDPERDTLESLERYARERSLDPARWLLLRGKPEQVRELASALDFRYRAEGARITHTARIVLVDREGVERSHCEVLAPPTAEIARAAAELG
jgi:protein SCO1